MYEHPTGSKGKADCIAALFPLKVLDFRLLLGYVVGYGNIEF